MSAKARTLSLGAILRMSDDEAHAKFVAIRFADNGGEPFCPKCECLIVYPFATRPLWKCKACRHQFSVTSGVTSVSMLRVSVARGPGLLSVDGTF